MPDRYYTNSLYPLQDKVLSEIRNTDSYLYLTGGTVVSRLYLNHRYSDDLDLFANQHAEFGKEIDRIVIHLKKSFEVDLQVKEDSYGRAFVTESDLILKIDFVNDVGFHAGSVIESPLYYRTDNWENILSNKVTSLSREEGKDLADILFICYNYSFNWEEIINDAKRKDSWIDEVTAAKLIGLFPMEKVQRVKWIENPNFSKISEDIKTISKDILLGADNSLASSR